MQSPEETATLLLPLAHGNAIEADVRNKSLCSNCQYNEETYPTTTAAQSKSNNINKDIRRTRRSASDGCWMCAVLMAATRLWNLSVQEEEEHINFYVRYDAERFTIRNRKLLPNLQVYSVGEMNPRPATMASESPFWLTSIIQDNLKYGGSLAIPSSRPLQPRRSLPNSLRIT